MGSDVMFSGSNNDVFTDRELLVMKLMYQRPSGNARPRGGLAERQRELEMRTPGAAITAWCNPKDPR